MQSWTVPSVVGIAIVLGAVAVTATLIVLLFPLLRRYALARPNARSSHTIPTPQGGGIAVVAATLATLAGAVGWTGVVPWHDLQLLAILLGTTGLAAVGMIDDIRPIPPAPRLALQALAVGLVIAALPCDLRVLPLLPGWIERVGLGLGLLWFVNLVNFMDGIDWMSVAEIVPVTAALGLLSALGAVPPLGGLAALALLGAMLGFAPFNRPRAKLFLGDVGSLPIGLVTGWLLIGLAGSGHLAAALLLPLYYLADATLTLLLRLRRRERVWEAHRSHFYQRATTNGLSVGQVIARVALVNMVLAGLAVTSAMAESQAVSVAALCGGAVVVGVLLVGFARPRPAHDNARGIG
ncbi:MAG: glycosyl transferase [Rhodoplanes sp.]|uniref:glycosyl transferase n=1 Tax=Rhodoplanes sp. TaxID=1968906 RepID=UPI0017F045AE|nr:glycosyl transferase [Rhodoplanes sp.]NVO17988.1 glycosyl transferase [Rhodoplanes sp.]